MKELTDQSDRRMDKTRYRKAGKLVLFAATGSFLGIVLSMLYTEYGSTWQLMCNHYLVGAIGAILGAVMSSTSKKE